MRTKTSFRQVVRYCVAGTAGFTAYYAALYGLTEYFGVWYVTSAVIGSILHTGLNFTLQKFWAFQNKETHMIGRQLAQYVTMMVSFFVGNTVFLYLMVEYLRMWYIGAQMILTIVISITSFIISGRIFKNEGTNA